MEKLKVLVMYATDYSIKDEDTGRINEGCTIQYYNLGEKGELLQQIGSVSGRPEGPVGYQRAKCSADISLRKKITLLPAIYDPKSRVIRTQNNYAGFMPSLVRYRRSRSVTSVFHRFERNSEEIFTSST
ncbi:MAG: hypothetical protein J5527_05210, partial [Treponema sp.]|nr:hypothetical protein [Treponema sp.]